MRRILLALLRLAGWKSVLVWPPEPRGLILVYPHTSNWDFVLGVLYRFGYGLPAHWMGKDAMFRWPFAGLMRRIGGIPINRSEHTGFIAAIVAEFRRRDWLWVAITPEGTRAYTDYVKSGFYQIALAANVPVALGYIDYGSRTIGIDTYVRFIGDKEKDLQTLREFYADKRGRRPELAGRLQLKR